MFFDASDQIHASSTFLRSSAGSPAGLILARPAVAPASIHLDAKAGKRIQRRNVPACLDFLVGSTDGPSVHFLLVGCLGGASAESAHLSFRAAAGNLRATCCKEDMARRFPAIVRQLRSGQVTIPAEFRRLLGIEEETLLQMTLVSGELRIKPVRVDVDDRRLGSAWLKELYERFAPVREEGARFSEQEVDADIDRALAEVRKTHG